MVNEIGAVALVFLLLSGSAGLGFLIRPYLPEHHRARETVEMMQVTIGLLATFAALVLGLLTASVKQDFDRAVHDRQEYALKLTLLDQCLYDYGGETESARAKLHSYTAAVIASTWPSEPAPTGVTYPDTSKMALVGADPQLSRIMNQVGIEIMKLSPSDPVRSRTLESCLDRYKDVLAARLGVIEAARSDFLEPFYEVLVFWLVIIFICFGLAAPNNTLSIVTILLCALSLSSVIFVILDLSHPYGGSFSVSSASMREALGAMLNAH